VASRLARESPHYQIGRVAGGADASGTGNCVRHGGRWLWFRVVPRGAAFPAPRGSAHASRRTATTNAWSTRTVATAVCASTRSDPRTSASAYRSP